MMEVIRTWLLSVTCAALLLALADALMPKGTVKKVGKLTGGLILFLAVVSPVAQLDEWDLAGWIGSYRAQAAMEAAQLEETDADLLESIIAEETAAYIEEKAAELGAECRALVSCQTGESGLSVPTAVTVLGTLTEEQRQTLSRLIASDLAIPAERQRFDVEGATEE